MNKNILKITTILSSLIILPAVSMAKPVVTKDGSNGTGSAEVTVGNVQSGSSKQAYVNEANGEIISAGGDTVVQNPNTDSSVSKDVTYNKGSGVQAGKGIWVPGKVMVDKTVDVSKSGTEIDVDVAANNYYTGKSVNKDLTLTDEQAAAKHKQSEHKQNAKVQHKALAKEK